MKCSKTMIGMNDLCITFQIGNLGCYNDWTCHNKRNGGMLHGNISRNGYGNAIICRYGGSF